MADAQRFLREAGVEQEFGLSRAYLRKRRRLHLDPPFSRIGRMVLYDREQVVKFIRSHQVVPDISEGK